MSVLDLHLVQSFPPSCLNRDENQMPKSAIHGNVERARHSSQNRKRPIRFYLKALGESISIRSRGIPTLIRERLIAKSDDVKVVDGKVEVGQGRSETAIEKAIEAAYKVLGHKIVMSEEKEGMNTEHQFFNSDEEITRLTNVIDKHFDKLSAIVIPEEDDSKSRKRNNKLATADVAADVKKEIQACFDRLGEAHQAIDNVLFGRMIAEDKSMNLEACSQFAHAISTHEVSPDLDFFVAVDDLGRNATDMMDTTGFSAPTMYQYANLHLDAFFSKLNGRSQIAFEHFLEAVVKALPTGKQNSFAAHNAPDFVMGVVRTAWPQALHNAFVPAVKGNDLIRQSVNALGNYYDRLSSVYGTKETKKAVYFTTLEGIEIKNAQRVASFEEWVKILWDACRPEGK